MPTTPSFLYYGQVNNSATPGIWTVSGETAAGTANTLTATGSTIPTNGPAFWSLAGGSVSYVGYTSPDGGPVVYDSGVYYLLTNTAYSTFRPVSDPNFAVACFAAGTCVLTGRGERAVESLAVGETVVTARDGGSATIIWLGWTQIECRHHPCPGDVCPVRIAAGAFGGGRPLRDLLLSPDHAVFAEGVLIPVRYLLNGATITQENIGTQENSGKITYWHVELDRHDVLYANGLPTESYLDTGNRAAFANGPAVAHQRCFTADRAMWARDACAPLVEGGPILARVRRRLAVQARAMGRPVAAAFRIDIAAAGAMEVPIPPGVSRLCLTSSASVPPGERRRLGACIRRIRVDGQTVRLDDAALGAGFHAREGRSPWRWTDGEALLHVTPADRARLVAIDVDRLMTRTPSA